MLFKDQNTTFKFKRAKALALEHFTPITTHLRIRQKTWFQSWPCPEPVIIDILWGTVTTEVCTFRVESMNWVPTFPMSYYLLRYTWSRYLVATLKKSGLVLILKVLTLVATLYRTYYDVRDDGSKYGVHGQVRWNRKLCGLSSVRKL